MERLTKRTSVIPNVAFLSENIDKKLTACEIINLLIDRLAEYEDIGYSPAELKVIVENYTTPFSFAIVKPSDFVYKCVGLSVEEYLVTEVHHIANNEIQYYAKSTVNSDSTGGRIVFSNNDIGKCVFATKREAVACMQLRKNRLQGRVASLFNK